MYTRCPKCSTCFRVTERHLAIAKGKVRCGQCQHVFNAPEHAIDDLPTNIPPPQTSSQSNPFITPTVKTAVNKPVIPLAVVTEEKIKDIAQPVEEEKPQSPEIEKFIDEVSEIETPAVDSSAIEKAITKVAIPETPQFNADATMVADINALNKNDISDIDLDAPSYTNKNIEEDEDDLFDDSFDLNDAIDELTHDVEDDDAANDSVINEEATAKKLEQEAVEANNLYNVFTTDAYDATNAASVSDIMDEMEGQLSLNISEPSDDNKYDANHEFDFIELDNEADDSKQEHEEINDQTLAKFFDLDESEGVINEDDAINENSVDDFSFIESDNETENDKTKYKTNIEEPIDENELFDQVDLSDLQDDDITEDNVLEKTEQNSDDLNVPFQLRNDIEHLQKSAHRRIHPLVSLSFIIILLVLSFAQTAYFRSHDLVKLVPSTRPLLETFCGTVNCRYSGPRNSKQIQLISRDVRLHPKEKKALLISAAMINNAHFAQPYPNIHVRLSDISGNIVAERTFKAKTYMGKLSSPFLLMKSKIPVHINFEVVDPGKDAVNFEFTFL